MIWCNHQFLSLHKKTSADAPAAERRYEALWFVGYDGVSERYVMHLLGDRVKNARRAAQPDLRRRILT
jgi:hypothetical protein